jgi:threonine/homoserine/homoserine lactone efflux protein
MELSAVLGFAVIALTLIVVPGPDWAYVLAVGTRDHVVLPVVTGCCSGTCSSQRSWPWGSAR